MVISGGQLTTLSGNCCLTLLGNGYFSPYRSLSSYSSSRTSVVIVAAAPKKKKTDKVDRHSFISKPDEATGPFPEAVLLKQKKIQEDGRVLPEFVDAEEQELYESLNLLLESDLDVDKMRHYEVVYLIHEKHAEEVESVNAKVQDFLRKKRGTVWRFSDWGLRRLAYKIQKAKNAHYILMNFELGAKWINDFKSMLDKDERVIRHLVIKRDEAITEDCPPPEFHTMQDGMEGDEEEDDLDFDDDYEDWDGESEMDETNDNNHQGGIIYVDGNDDRENRNDKTVEVKSTGRRKLKL